MLFRKVNTMSQLKEKLYLCSGLLSGLCIVIITSLLLAQIVGRLFGFIVPSAEDFAGYALAASTFLGLAYTFREGGHIRVTLLIQRFSPVPRKIQEGIILILSFALLCYLSYACGYMVYESYIYEEVSYGYIPVPLWIPQLPVAIGVIALNLAILDALVSLLRGQKTTYSEQEDALSLEEI
ncbi:TRAP-type C4-dicarboxylate transport system permease small subunit [Marinomonas alcarazii]|uniref:TRAP transporter small permease protein n=2 Tax=Marinomonas alcarazii TaxID=491949 RepID=A0A318V3C8_9GAMM|nr:TRAP-type C4-dicarboxylate transport system permease small subunit [Marinomonas alcarazii]